MAPKEPRGWRTSERLRARQELINQAITNSVEPEFPRGSANYVLRLPGGKRALLARGDGSFTPEGEHWSARTGRALQVGIDYRQKPVTDGASQYIMVQGKRARIRTWDAARNQWTYTRTGTLWSANKKVKMIIEIPVTISGRNAGTGRQWERVGWLPYELSDLKAEKIMVRESLTPQQRLAAVKELVLQKAADASGTVYESSGETWTVAPDREWKASLMSTTQGPRGPVTVAKMHQSLSNVATQMSGSSGILDRAAGARPMRM